MNNSRVKSRKNSSRKRKRISTENGTSKNEPIAKRVKTEFSHETKKKKRQLVSKNSSAVISNACEIRIIIDKSIVDKYFRAKQMLREILLPNPTGVRSKIAKKSKERKKQASLLDYLQVKNQPQHCSSSSIVENSNDGGIIQNESIKKKPELLEETPRVTLGQTADFIHQNNTPMFGVNMQPIVYYPGNSPANCFLYNGHFMLMPMNARFTPEEFLYNNYGFMPVIGVPIKMEVSQESNVKEELDEMINSSITIDEHTMSDIMSIDGNATTSTPVFKTTIKKEIDESYDEEENEVTVKLNEHGFPTCPKCNRPFETLKLVKQHKLLCGLELLYDCLYCSYSSKHVNPIKRHVECNHKQEVKNDGIEKIMNEIQNKRTEKRTNEMEF